MKKKTKIKNIVCRSNTDKEKKRIVGEFINAFKNETDLNMITQDGHISYVGDILTKLDSEGLWFAINGKLVNV